MVNKKIKQQKSASEPLLGCDYHGYHFGAHYADACCVDGYLWDEDSYQDGLLTSGGDMPCPQCNTIAYLSELASDLQDGICGDNYNPEIWTRTVKRCFELNLEQTRRALIELGTVKPIFNLNGAPDGIGEAVFSYGHQPIASHYQAVPMLSIDTEMIEAMVALNEPYIKQASKTTVFASKLS